MNFLKYTLSLMAVSSIAYAGSYESPAEFCKPENINKEAANKVDTTNHVSVLGKMGTPLTAEKDCDFIKNKIKDPDWALIDARDSDARRASGTFEYSVRVPSDHHDPSKHQYSEDNLFKRLGKHFEKQGRKPASLSDVKEKNLMLFCNGLKCYRTPWAGCSLHEMGFKKENLYFILDGYDGLKKHCLKD